jgi:exopolysaccharide production protein ExoZ
LIYVLALTIFPALSASGRDWGWVSSILLLPTASPPALGPAWTLVHEMIFYVIFLIFFLVGRPVFALFIAIWALLIAFNSYIIPSAIAVKAPESGDGDALTQVLAEINLEFIAGMLCAFAYRRRWLFEYSIYIVALGLCGLLAMWALFPHDRQSIEQYRLSYGLLFAFVIFGLVVTWERKRLRTGALLVWLGYISYSLYLVHYPIISIISRVSGKIVPPHIASVNIAICLIVSLIAATIYNRYYEEPSLRVLRGLFARKSVGDYSRDQKS